MRSAAEFKRAGPPVPADLRRRALRQIRDGASMFVIAGGLFGWYVWWSWSAEDPPPGTWLRWVFVWFGWLISGVLFVLLALALLGPSIAYTGFRQWLRLRRGEHPEAPNAKVAGPDVCPDATHPSDPHAPPSDTTRPAPQIRLECRKCGSAKVEKLPPNGISPRPGYVCKECGAKMRAPGMLVPYVVVLVLGVGVAGLFLSPLFGGGDKELLVQGLWFVGVGLICAGYSLRQIVRPVPRRVPHESD
jgi:hypothetical protein